MVEGEKRKKQYYVLLYALTAWNEYERVQCCEVALLCMVHII